MMKGRSRQSPERKAVPAVPAVPPNSSRVRTPTGGPLAFTSLDGDEGYFPPVSSSPKSIRKVSPP